MTRTTVHRGLILALTGVLIMQVIAAFRFEVNWDEFLNLSMLHDHRRGTLTELLQTGFIHLFFWLPTLSPNEVDQVVAARLVIGIGAAAMSWAIFAMARRLSTTDAALFAVLAFWSFSYVFHHAVALRTDALAALTIMLALWCAMSGAEHMRRIALAGALTGLAGVLTIKAIFFVPTLVIVTLARATSVAGWHRAVLAVAVAGLCALGLFVIAITAHSLTFETYASPLAFLERTTDATLTDPTGSLFWFYAQPALQKNFLVIAIAALGLGVACSNLLRGPRLTGIYALALALPLLTPLVYRDVYPYFYPFLLAPAAVLTALGYARIATFGGSASVPLVLIGTTFVVTVGHFATALRQDNQHQRQILAVIDTLFDKSTPYIDARTMVSSRPKTGLFMSAWGMKDYRRTNRPVMAGILQSDRPGFLLVNDWQLEFDRMTPKLSQDHPYGLLREDVETLMSAFVPFWGPVWVPGAFLGPEDQDLILHIDGTYLVTGPGPVTIDGQAIAPGQTLHLDAGQHEIDVPERSAIRLDLPPPDQAPPEGPVFRGF